MLWQLILVILTLVLFGLAFFGVGSKYNLVAGGLFCWLLSVSLALFHG